MSQAVSPSRDVTASPGPGAGPVNKHAPTPLERQRMQLEKLLKDPSKPAHIPPPPKDKALRPPREMMKNVQGSSAGNVIHFESVWMQVLTQFSLYIRRRKW